MFNDFSFCKARDVLISLFFCIGVRARNTDLQMAHMVAIDIFNVKKAMGSLYHLTEWQNVQLNLDRGRFQAHSKNMM